MVWQPDVWARALRATEQTSFRLCRTKDECERLCTQHPGWRLWAFDLGRAPDATNHPKAFVAASVDTFLAAYKLVPAQHRYAYEVVRGPCHLFFDLELEGEEWQRGTAMAEVVEEAACTVVAELAAQQRLQVRIDTVAIDCDHAAKFSRHLLVCVTADGEPVLWRGPREARRRRPRGGVGRRRCRGDRPLRLRGWPVPPAPRLAQAVRRAPRAARAQRVPVRSSRRWFCF